MRFTPVLLLGVLTGAAGLCLYGQSTPAKEAPNEAKGLPPRASATDYQFHTKVGPLTIAAEFTGHSITTEEGPLSDEDYVAVEMGLFGAPGTHVQISSSDFSLRINEKKAPLPSRQFGMVFSSLKDPYWNPPKDESKPKSGGLSTGGGEDPSANDPPPPVKMPFNLQRAITLRVEKAALPEGDRQLPVAGVVFFQYHGKEKGIHSLELIYEGPAGKASLELQP